jgi:Protein of unknown function (DUF1360)
VRWIPDWWQFLLLMLAAYRIYHLLADDTILDRPRKWVLGLPRSYDPDRESANLYPGYRENVATWLTCPWCAGFWISLGWWAAWLITPKWATVAAVPWALSALVGLIGKHLE